MSRVRRAITLFSSSFFSFSPSFFLFLSINVVIPSFIECMPVESPFPPSFSRNCGWVGGWVDVQARVSVCE